MKEPGAALRKAFFTALNGNLAYSGNVPVFDEKVEGTHDIYVLLLTTTNNDRTNKSVFVTEKNLDIEIYNIRKSTAKSEVLDNIAGQILEIILPTPKTVGITIDTPFRLTFTKLEASNLEGIQAIDGNRFLHAKRLTFRNRITQ